MGQFLVFYTRLVHRLAIYSQVIHIYVLDMEKIRHHRLINDQKPQQTNPQRAPHEDQTELPINHILQKTNNSFKFTFFKKS